MTVSPGWPQDGKGPSQKHAGASHSAGDAREVLPPTLFQLPNLKPSAVAERTTQSEPFLKPEPESKSGSTRSIDSTQQFNTRQVDSGQSNQVERIQVPTDSHSSQNLDSLDSPLTSKQAPNLPTQRVSGEDTHAEWSPDPTNDPSKLANRSTRPLVDIPAVRKWAESIGSHGVVLALLVVVVVAALITGRGGRDQDLDSTLAQHSDLLEFDRGDLVMIPDSELPLSDSPADPPQLAELPANEPESATSVAPVFSAEPTQPTTEVAANVTLESPAEEIAPIDPAMGSSTESTPPGIRVNEFFSRTGEVKAQTASSRSGVATIPNLDQLADPVPTPATQHRLSRTPAKMNDLLQYLPPRPESVSSTPGGEFTPDFAADPTFPQ